MASWKTDGDWAYEYFPLIEPESSFPGFEDILRIWRNKAVQTPPSWRDFDFMDFRGWWGWISVYDAVDGQPLCFDVRLWGTHVVEVTGHDLAGKRLSIENLPRKSDPRGISANSMNFVRFVLDESVIGLTTEPYRSDWGTHLLYREVLLPLSSDGDANDKVLFAGMVPKQS